MRRNLFEAVDEAFESNHITLDTLKLNESSIEDQAYDLLQYFEEQVQAKVAADYPEGYSPDERNEYKDNMRPYIENFLSKYSDLKTNTELRDAFYNELEDENHHVALEIFKSLIYTDESENLMEDGELKYSYAVDELRDYLEEDKESNMSNVGMSEEEFEDAVNEALKNIDHIESSEPITTISQMGGSDYQGFNGGTVITYLTDGRKFIWEEGDESDLPLWDACELVLSNEISDDGEEDVVGFDKERELERLHQYDESDEIVESPVSAPDDLRAKVSEYICDDYHKMEDFTDIEVSANTLDSVHKIIDRVLAKIGDEEIAKMSTEIDNGSIDLTDYAHYAWELAESEENDTDLLTKYKLNGDDEFKYMMLSRMQSDCKYVLGASAEGSENGIGDTKHLWVSDDPKTHCALMRALYNSVSEKPDWISIEEIDGYEEAMTPKVNDLTEDNNEDEPDAETIETIKKIFGCNDEGAKETFKIAKKMIAEYPKDKAEEPLNEESNDDLKTVAHQGIDNYLGTIVDELSPEEFSKAVQDLIDLANSYLK